MSGQSAFWEGLVHFVDAADIHGSEPWASEARDLFSVLVRLTRKDGRYDVWASFRDGRRDNDRHLGLDYGDLVELLEALASSDQSLLLALPNWGKSWDHQEIKDCFLLVDLGQRLQIAFPHATIKMLFAAGPISLQSSVRLVK